MYILQTANIMFLSFIRFELLSVEHGNPISHKNVVIYFCSSFAMEKFQYIEYHKPTGFLWRLKYGKHNAHRKCVIYSLKYELNILNLKKIHQVEVIEQILAKLVPLCVLFKGKTNFLHTPY